MKRPKENTQRRELVKKTKQSSGSTIARPKTTQSLEARMTLLLKQQIDDAAEELLRPMIDARLEAFATHLAIARRFYEKHRELVTASAYPEYYSEAYRNSSIDKNTGKALVFFVTAEDLEDVAPTIASLRKELIDEAREKATDYVNHRRLRRSHESVLASTIAIGETLK